MLLYFKGIWGDELYFCIKGGELCLSTPDGPWGRREQGAGERGGLVNQDGGGP